MRYNNGCHIRVLAGSLVAADAMDGAVDRAEMHERQFAWRLCRVFEMDVGRFVWQCPDEIAPPLSPPSKHDN
jgi:hypothetical protein